MAATPKVKAEPVPAPVSRADRTSAVVTATLILLTALGVVTVFWEPLTALAVGAPSAESVAEPRAAAADAGSLSTSSPSTNGGPIPAAGPVDASGSS
jgi:hypothetical protein